jgi:hypothetical protein
MSDVVAAALERHAARMAMSPEERAEMDARADRHAAFQGHLRYLDSLRAAPLAIRDNWEATEWRKYSAYLDRLWNTSPQVARAMEIIRMRGNAR